MYLLHDYLKHIHDETKFIIKYCSEIHFEIFINNEVLKKAVVRCLEVIGEATKKLPTEFKSKNPQIEWRAIAGTRDKLIHEYFGVDYEIVWDMVEKCKHHFGKFSRRSHRFFGENYKIRRWNRGWGARLPFGLHTFKDSIFLFKM